MRGYSFAELVKLAEAALPRAGGDITGQLALRSSIPSLTLSDGVGEDWVLRHQADYTAMRIGESGPDFIAMTGGATPKVEVRNPLSLTAQNSAVNALTRKDYVDTELGKKLDLTGGTLTGNLTAAAVFVSGAQSTQSNALTRRDFVLQQLGLKFDKAGGDITGATRLISASPKMDITDTATGNNYTWSVNAATIGLREDNTTGTKIWQWDRDSNTLETGGALTVAGGAIANGYWSSRVQATDANAMTRKDYVDTELNKKLSLTGGTVNGVLTLAGTAVATLVLSDSTGADFAILHANNYTAFREGTGGGDFMSFNGGGVPTVAMVNPVTNSPQLGTGNALARKDYVDSQVASRAPASHTHNAADGNYDIVANISLWGQIGSYMYATTLEATGARGPGHIASGANMRAANSESGSPGGGASLPGQWKLMGFVKGTGANTDQNTSLWFRVS